MFIANCTNQVQDFHYRLPENPKVLKQTIPIGGQIQIPGDLSTPDIEAIVRQHTVYGMVSVQEIDRTKDFIGICYQLDRKVDMERVKRAAIHNLGVLNERGRKLRQEAAVAVNNAIEEQTNGVQAFEMSIEEQESQGKDIEVNEKVRVSKYEEPQAPVKARGARPRKVG